MRSATLLSLDFIRFSGIERENRTISPHKRWFLHRDKTEEGIVTPIWRRHYNEVRPHSSLGYMTPQQAGRMEKTGLSTQARL
ncbi:MAG: transposase [Azoarcus sp.]|nr:transposase [Azoarcus sp.]